VWSVEHALPMVSGAIPLRATLAPRLTIRNARDAMVSFVFHDETSDDPVVDFGHRWCAWDGGAPAPAEVLETSGVDANAPTRVVIALAPNATHLAVARGRRLAVVATHLVAGKTTTSSSSSGEGAFPENADAARANRRCVAEVRDASGPDHNAYVTCVCWISFAGTGGNATGAAVRAPRQNANSDSESDACVAVGASDGCLRVFAIDGTLLITKRLDFGTGPESPPSPIRALHVRDTRRSPSRDELSEDLVAVADSCATKVDSLELQSVLKRARMMRASTASQARFFPDSQDMRRRENASHHTPLTTTRWCLARLAPVADAVSVGRLPPSVARAGLARREDPSNTSGEDGTIGGVTSSSRGVGVLAAGLGDPRGDSGTVCLLASYDDDDRGLADLGAALARKTASAAANTVRHIFGGAVGLARGVTQSLPVGTALTGAVVGVVEKAGKQVGTVAGEALSLESSEESQTAKARPLTWRSAIVDPPRRVRRFAPAPRGPLVAAADSLGRVTVLDVAAPATLATVRVIKGCRDAEMGWVELPPPRGSNARVVAITGT
jgi:hypothetical protein